MDQGHAVKNRVPFALNHMEVVLMGISSKCVQVPIPSAMHDLAPAIIEASLSTSEAKEANMSSKRQCESYKKNTDVQCGNGGPRDIHHNDHRHHVCGQHMESDRFVNCDKAEKLHKVEQPTLSLPNTDGLTAIQKLKEQMESAVPNPTKEEAMATLNTNPKLVCVFGERFDINKELVLNHLTVDTDEKPCLYNRIKAAIGEFEVVSGGASGADFIGAKAAKIMGIPFHLVVPHPGYHEHYLKQGTHISDEVWSQMLESAKSVTYSVNGKVAFHGSFNNKRNEDMAKMAEYFVVISKLAPIPQSKLRYGGTKNMLNTLKARGVTRVYWINSQNGLGRWMATS